MVRTKSLRKKEDSCDLFSRLDRTTGRVLLSVDSSRGIWGGPSCPTCLIDRVILNLPEIFGAVLKDERRTSNIEKKQTLNTEHSTTIPVSSFFLFNIHCSFIPIQRSMLDVRCSMFIFSVPPGQKQLSAYGMVPRALISRPSWFSCRGDRVSKATAC